MEDIIKELNRQLLILKNNNQKLRELLKQAEKKLWENKISNDLNKDE